ncbi:MAG: hypothetical protein FJ292_04740 [Planctomycetes bacterium]|nr:hypothetical protein [Planctomycetota bacterium]
MNAVSIAQVNARVREVADRIQPLLAPHAGLARRNAHAHAWLGIKTVFGEQWRERADLGTVLAFVEWLDANPNADYEAYDGPVRHLAPDERGLLFD